MDDAGERELIALIHDAAAGFGSWTDVTDRALSLFGGTSGSVFAFDEDPEPDIVGMSGFSETARRLYAEHYHSVDLWAELGRLRPSMRAVLSAEHVPEAVYDRSEIWNDYSRQHVGAYHMVGAAIPLDAGAVGLVGLHRPRDAPAFDARDRARLERLLPYLRSGLSLRGRLAGLREAARAAEDALHLLDFGVVIVDAAAAPVFVNAEAERIAAAGDVIRLQPRLVEAVAPEAGRALRRLAHDAARGGPGGALLLDRPAGGAPVWTRIAPLAPSLGAAVRREGDALAMIALGDLGRGGEGCAAILRQTFGLTPAEARLAEDLLAGLSVAESAERHGLAVSTLRFQLHAVLAKTGTRRQAELLQRLGRIPQLRVPDG